jgi:3-oxoadipate enol-lactonase
MIDTLAINGAELVYEAWGDGDVPLLLLHGFTGSRLDWADVVDDLARDRLVVAYDQRGHGDSTNFGDVSAYTFERLAADLDAVVADRGLAPIDLLGHSMGGIIAMRYAIDHPDTLRSLVLMDTAGAPAGGIPRAWVDGVLQNARENGMSAVAEMMVRFLDAQDPPARQAVKERVRRKLSNMDQEAFAGFSSALSTYESMLDELSSLSMPVTVLVGENDTGLREGADVLAKTIPGAELVVIPDAGHSPQEDNAAAWLAAVRDHLERVG